MRNKIIAGNWKMNLNYAEALSLVDTILDMMDDEGRTEVVLAPPFIYLRDIVSRIQGITRISIAAQNCSHFINGAHTGEVSASMLSSVGVEFVIVGHSERRQEHHETNLIIREKIDRVLEQFLIPVFCCGESSEQRKNNIHIETIRKQVGESLFHLSASQLRNCVIAYEPVWAIGTGVNASVEQIDEIHLSIREVINEQYKSKLGDEISVLYGGSVNAANAAELFSCNNVDGALVGGASLRLSEFSSIISSMENIATKNPD